jgi:hypothetical protein
LNIFRICSSILRSVATGLWMDFCDPLCKDNYPKGFTELKVWKKIVITPRQDFERFTTVKNLKLMMGVGSTYVSESSGTLFINFGLIDLRIRNI